MNKNLIVTGANRGVGLELVKQSLTAGDHVFAGCRYPHQAESLLRLKRDFGELLDILPLDVTCESSIHYFVSQVDRTVDVLINNAGIYGPKAPAGEGMEEFAGPALSDINTSDWLEVLNVNTVAPLMMTRAVLPLMREESDKKIVMVSTMMGSIGDKDYGGAYIYSSSKAALNMVGKTLHNELDPAGYHVVMVHPGWVQTDMGGKNAETTVVDSAAGILAIAERFDIAGQFMNFDGTARQW